MTTTTMILRKVYRCGVCGNIVEKLHIGGGTLSCCNQAMNELAENTVEASTEKHIPIINVTPTGVEVMVGAVAHPMEEKHYIMWIELITGGQTYRRFLRPGDMPYAIFTVTGDDFVARAYCNLHGIWKG